VRYGYSFNHPGRRVLQSGGAPSAVASAVALLNGRADSGIWDGRAATDSGTLTVANLSGLAPSFSQATAINKPAISTLNGLGFDGANDQLTAVSNFPTGVLFSFYALVNVMTAGGRILRDEVFYSSPSVVSPIASGSGSVAVDGAAITTREGLSASLQGGFRLLSVTGFDLTNPLAFGRDVGGGGAMNLIGWAFLRESEFANLAAARTTVIAALNSMRPA